MKSKELAANRLHAVLARNLEDMILQGAYAAGDMLPSARELATQYGVSTAVVRDAICILTGKGLVVPQQGVGTSVALDLSAGLTQSLLWALRHAQVTEREIRELAGVVETQCAILAASRRTDADLQALESAVSPGATDANDSDARNAPAGFHSALIGSAHNRALAAVYEPLLEVIEGPSEPDGPGDNAALVAQQHRRILDCIRRGDIEATRIAMQEHTHVS